MWWRMAASYEQPVRNEGLQSTTKRVHYVGSRSSSSSPAFMPAAATHILTVTTGEALSKNHQSRPLPDPQKLWKITIVCFCKPH